MINQNLTISRLSLKTTTSISPIYLLPVLSLSTSNFYFSKISASYSFAQFINGKKFNFLSVKNSKFSYFLGNVIRVDSEYMTYYTFTPVFTKNCEDRRFEQDIEIVGCQYGPNPNTPLHCENSNLKVYSSNFHHCISTTNGGGIYHRNGYFKTDSNDFRGCQSDQCGGGFYHDNGTIKIWRCTFNGNMAKDRGSHFCIMNYDVDDTLYLHRCYFTTISRTGEDAFIFIKSNNFPIIRINSQYCRYNFTNDNLTNYIENNYTTIKSDEDKFAPENYFDYEFNMKNLPSKSFTPTLQFTMTIPFTETIPFTSTSEFTQSANFTASLPFTQSDIFAATRPFSPSSYFSATSYFTATVNFTASSFFTASSNFTASSYFTASSAFSRSVFFSSSNAFSESNPFTESITFTPIYTPIPTRSPFKTPTSTRPFTASSQFTPSHEFTSSSGFSSSFTFGSADLGPIAQAAATKKPLKGGSIMITLIVLGALLLLLGLIANIILCVQMVQAGEIIITQQM